MIKGIGLLICKRGTLGLQRVQYHLCDYLLITVIRKGDTCLCEMQSVSFLESGYLDELRYITVGDVIHVLDILKELITVLDYHQLVTSDQTVLLELHSRAYSQIIFDSPPVGAAEYNCLILIILPVGIRYLLYQIPSADPLYVIETGSLQLHILQVYGIRSELHLIQQLAQHGGIIENSGFLLLTHDCLEFGIADTSHRAHVIPGQGRRGIQTYRRQLRCIAYKYDLAPRTCAYERNQVLKQIARPEGRSGLLLSRLYAYQRNFINNEQCILALIGCQRELSETVTSYRLLPVDMLMDSVGLLSGISRKNLRGPACRCKQH